MSDGEEDHDVTRLLDAWSDGDASARDRMMSLVVDDLRQIAHQQYRGRYRSRTLQPTQLIGYLYERLSRKRTVQFNDRRHFFGFAALEMRKILCDYARLKLADKRGGGVEDLRLEELGDLPKAQLRELVELDDALKSLARVNPEQAKIVELHAFGGLTLQEIAEQLGISRITARRRWRAACLWLREIICVDDDLLPPSEEEGDEGD
jgi:RNA polymerase sigma factor (TIGR02999 family)